MYTYSVITYYENGKNTLETNDINVVLTALVDAAEAEIRFDVVDNYTGEILCHPDAEQPNGFYFTPEMRLMLIGWLVANFPDALPFFTAL